MHTMREVARPGLGGDGRARQGTRPFPDGHDYDNPLALVVSKPSRGRDVMVGKCTFLEHERIFAIAHDRQVGVDTHLSLPEVVLDFARQRGCQWVYFWRAATLEVRRLPFDRLLSIGYWGPGAGREWYWPIAAMEPVGTWARPKWEWAEQVVRLGDASWPPEAEPEGQQLALEMAL